MIHAPNLDYRARRSAGALVRCWPVGARRERWETQKSYVLGYVDAYYAFCRCYPVEI